MINIFLIIIIFIFTMSVIMIMGLVFVSITFPLGGGELFSFKSQCLPVETKRLRRICCMRQENIHESASTYLPIVLSKLHVLLPCLLHNPINVACRLVEQPPTLWIMGLPTRD